MKHLKIFLILILVASVTFAFAGDLTRIVSVRKAPIQVSPDAFSTVKGFVKLGTPLEIIEVVNEYWVKVKYMKVLKEDMEGDYSIGYIHTSAIVTEEMYVRQQQMQDENESGLAAGAKGFSEDAMLSNAAKGFSEDAMLSNASKGFSEDAMLSNASKGFSEDQIQSAASKGFSEDQIQSAASKGFSEDQIQSAASKGFSEDQIQSAASKGFSEDQIQSAASKGFNSEIEAKLRAQNKEVGYQVLDNIVASGNYWDVTNPQKRMIQWRQEGRLGEFSPYYSAGLAE